MSPSRRTVLAAATAGVLASAGGLAVGQATPAFAAESSPVGFASLNGGTTGGSSGTVVTVTTASALKSALSSGTSQTVRVSGLITISGMYGVASNKTVIGVGSGSGITGGGLNLSGVRNVILRNLVFKNAADDSINVQSGSTNIWIDHNDLSNGYDGLIDIKRGSDFVTVSWNHLHNHDKSMLLGHSDDNSAQDLGHLRVTYVHNWFDGTNQRHPRVRFANPVHVLNNYYSNVGSYGVASTENAGVFVERNYFENVAHPTVTQTGDSDAGNLKVLNNYKVNSGAEEVRNGASVAAIPYSYTPEANTSVKATVTAGAGTGKI
ncbi:pectate lyase [Actinoplanes cyaneus]|uniref:Pectate lyase n=1 Tax=Actinoplanes cyaneus TaxID=52696 RepID=A0A919M1K2_9ACTN|nr:pectate lyase [Actinoplanes cyaneus]MCW2136134.1 pectate lyase [Actinoplanes cyaneus]GID62497.1 pectate lyase [Actinoplanes cyaneus]